MKPANIITATAMILIVSSLLTGCKIDGPVENQATETNKQTSEKTTPDNTPLSEETQTLIQKAETVKKEAQLRLETEQNGKELNVTIVIENPSQKGVNSVQSWLSYDPNKLAGVKIDTSESSFLLSAPYENTFDPENGVAMIGRSHPTGLTDSRLVVAKVQFEVTASGPITLDAYNYQEDLSGNTSANLLVDGDVFNILIKPDSPAAIVTNQ